VDLGEGPKTTDMVLVAGLVPAREERLKNFRYFVDLIQMLQCFLAYVAQP
jgi:hypothetical protein